MKKIDRAIEILTHRDYDLVVLLGTAVLLFAAQVIEKNWMLALFAGTLASFALSMIQLRHDIGGKASLSSIFLDHTPAEVTSRMASAETLLLVGVSLDRTLRNAYTPLENFLQSGGKLRVLVVDPGSEAALRIADRRAYQVQGIDRRRDQIVASIDTFFKLKEKTGGDVEVRITDDPLTFGSIMIDGIDRTINSQIVIQHYSYKKRNAREPNPVFAVRPSDGQWFDEYREELENLWNDGQAVHAG